MLIHHLTFVQLKTVFVSKDGWIVVVEQGLHPDDVFRAEFYPIIAMTISVEGLGYHFQRLYSSSKLPLSTFLHDAWSNVELTFGVPEVLVVDERLLSEVNITQILGGICHTPPVISTITSKKYHGSRRAAQGVHSYLELSRHLEPEAIIPLPVQNFLHGDRKPQTPDRREVLSNLESREVVRPDLPNANAVISVSDWMRDSAVRIPLLGKSKRLIYKNFHRNADHYIVGLQQINVAGDKNWLSGRLSISLSQHELLLRSVWALTIYSFYELEQILDVEDFRETLWGNAPINIDDAREITEYIANLSFFFPERPNDISVILSVIGASVMRGCELKTTKESQVLACRYLVLEVDIAGELRLVMFVLDVAHIKPGDSFLSGFPLVDVEILNKGHFEEVVRDVWRYECDPAAALDYIGQLLSDSEEWSYLVNANVLEGSQSPLSKDVSKELGIRRDLLISAFQALYRERSAAFKVLVDACKQGGSHPPSPTQFRIEEVSEVLLSLGSTPEF